MMGVFGNLQKRLEASRALQKIYEQRYKAQLNQCSYLEGRAQKLTDDDKINEAKHYWNQLASATKLAEAYEKKMHSYNITSEKILNRYTEAQYNTGKLERMVKAELIAEKKLAHKVGKHDNEIDQLLNDLDQAEEVSIHAGDYTVGTVGTNEGERLMSRYLQKKKAIDTSLDNEEESLSEALAEIQGN